MAIQVKDPTIENGLVEITHPSLENAAKNMAKDGKTREEIAKRTGLPMEVAEKYERAARKER